MKRTIIAVISMVLILFAFSACRPTVVGIPVDPTPGTPVTPSDPSIPENTIQVGGESYHNLDEAIAAAPENGTINIGKGRFIIPSTLTLSKNLTINGAGMNDTIIEVYGDYGFDVDGNSSTISNLTIADASGTASRLLNVQASQILIDHVRLEGKYNSNSSGATNSGILADSNVTDITVKNSEFKGIRMPLNIDLENAENPKVTISENVFDTFLKLAFTTDIESMNISSDNVFENYDEESEFQIELFTTGDLTADKAIKVAKATGLVVKAELEEKTYYYFGAEGFIINNIDDLKSFADGKAGTKAKLAAPISITETVNFTADNLELTGTDDFVVTVNSSNGDQLKGFEIDGSHITLNSIVFQEEGTDRIDFVVADGDDITVNGCTFIGDLTKEDMDRVIYGVSSYGDKTQVLDSHFKNLRVPFYFTEHSATNGVATGNFITGCYKVDLETPAFVEDVTGNTFTDGLQNYDIGILKGGTAEIAMKLAADNNGCCIVKSSDNVIYNKDGIVVSDADELVKAFEASMTLDETINVTIIKSFAIDTDLNIGQGNGLKVVSADGAEVTINGMVNLTNVTDVEFDGVVFNVGSSVARAFIVNTSSDVEFVNKCIFTKGGDKPNGVAISVNGYAGNIKVTDCVFTNFVTTIYSDLNRGEITGNTINGYGGIYILSNNNIANNAEAMNYPDLTVSGNVAGYDIDLYDPESTSDDRFDNTLRFAVADATTALSKAVMDYAADLKTENPGMNVAVIHEGTYPNIPVLWANNTDYSSEE